MTPFKRREISFVNPLIWLPFLILKGTQKLKNERIRTWKKKEKYKNHKNRPSLGLFLDFSTISILRHIGEFRFYNRVYFRHQTFYVPICQNNECFLKLENVKKGVETVRTHSIHLICSTKGIFSRLVAFPWRQTSPWT